ncbi:MAG TPA: pyrroline-5-carboxylate reductase [Candidatus Saccharimonadales bacterium]|nr:pyrroline-5-carboxylate reductase [Candidatus Saccharimonadales bacterium]
MYNTKIAIIGVGNMGNAIAHALLDQKIILEEELILANPSFIEINAFAKTAVIQTTNNKQAAEQADILILAVKPQKVASVLSEIQTSLSSDKLIISIAAGVSVESLKKMLGNIKQPIIRSMPNLCLQVKESMTAWIASEGVTEGQKKAAIEIFTSFGKQIMLDKEPLLDVVTAISGSGPAYIFYLAEILENAAIKLGIDQTLAEVISRQTIIGAATLLSNSKETPTALRDAVTSKGGTTEAALAVFERDSLQDTFFAGINAAFNRAKELNK